MATEGRSPSFDMNAGATERLEVAVYWEGEPRLPVAVPSAIEIAGVLIGLEEAYEALARALGYPPHFLKVSSMRNPELKFGLEGGKEVIDAVRELLYAVPSLIANLFRPKAAWRRAQLEEQVRTKELEARAASAEAQKIGADADAAEALARKLRADAEAAEMQRLRAELEFIPIRADATAHAVLSDVAAAVARADPDRRIAFIADTARYAVVANSFDAKSHIHLVPVSNEIGRPVRSVRRGPPKRRAKATYSGPSGSREIA